MEQLVFADRPRGKGLDKTRAGYQIAACSPGISEAERKRISLLCVHYGAAFQQHAPREALDRQSRWRRERTGKVDAMPAEILELFPEIWCYHRLADDRYALASIRYKGISYDGRLGSFLCHVLVFHPKELAAFDFNPMTLARSGKFRDDFAADQTVLEPLDALAPKSLGEVDHAPLKEGALRAHLPALLSALAEAVARRRPIVLGLEDWRGAKRIAEALLALLPPAFRCRTTLCSYESNRSWVPETGRERVGVATGAHELIVLCGGTGRPVTLSPRELKSVYSVFNFIGNQFSPPEKKPGPYAAFAAECLDGGIDRLKRLQGLIEALGCGREAGAWDALKPVTEQLADLGRPESLVMATKTLASLTPSMKMEGGTFAAKALDLLTPHVLDFAEAEQSAALEEAVPHLQKLNSLVGTGSTGGEVDPRLRERAEKRLGEGKWGVLAALLSVAGGSRRDLLVSLLKEWALQSDPPLPNSVPELERMLDLVDQALNASLRAELWSGRLLLFAFRAAQKRDSVEAAWEKIGRTQLVPWLDAGWGEDKEKLAWKLLACFGGKDCPAGRKEINRRLLQKSPAQGDDFVKILVELAYYYCDAKDADPVKETRALIAAARGRLGDGEVLASALAFMGDLVLVTDSGRVIFDEYAQEMGRLAETEQDAVRRRLAQAGKLDVLCLDFTKAALREKAGGLDLLVSRWRDQFMRPHPKLQEYVLSAIAKAIVGGDEGLRPLAGALLAFSADGQAAPGLEELRRAVGPFTRADQRLPGEIVRKIFSPIH